MHNRSFDVRQLTVAEKRDLCTRAKAICKRWWVDELDCTKSMSRQIIEMSFDNILQKLDEIGRAHV